MSETSMPQMPEDQLPQEVVAKLRERSAAPISVPRTMDEAILANARSVLHEVARAKQVQPLRRTRKWTVGLVSVGSLAAALLIAVTSQWNVPDIQPQPARSIADYTTSDDESFGSIEFHREDVDRSGNVDILDAFALARQVRRSDTNLVTGDQNGDGVINEADVEWIAMSAVML
ncbi:MAG: dockerin type I domain-containing protein [Fuerstiella sp.]